MEDEDGANAVTWDLFESESSFNNVIPQFPELHGFGTVPTKVVENGWTWK